MEVRLQQHGVCDEVHRGAHDLHALHLGVVRLERREGGAWDTSVIQEKLCFPKTNPPLRGEIPEGITEVAGYTPGDQVIGLKEV